MNLPKLLAAIWRGWECFGHFPKQCGGMADGVLAVEKRWPANGELQLPGAEPQQPSPLMLGCVARDLTGLSDGGQATFSSGGG